MIIYAERPGLIIGRRGRNIKDLTDVLEERYGFENLQIEVEEIPIPELSPQIMASRIAAMLKAGRPFRRSAYMNLKKIEEAGAQGVEITISGKIRGERARTVRFVSGAITKCGEPAKQVQQGLAVADLKQGMLGIKVKIMPPDTKMPDYVDLEMLKEKASPEPEVSEEEAEVSEEEAKESEATESEVEESESEIIESDPAIPESDLTEPSSEAVPEPEPGPVVDEGAKTELKIEVTEVPAEEPIDETGNDESGEKKKESGGE
jgi:small subunit ribosomal protein S3